MNSTQIKLMIVTVLVMMSSCSDRPHKELVATIDSIIEEEIKYTERIESSSTSYKQWITNLYQDCIIAKALVSDVRVNRDAIMSFQTKDYSFFPKNYLNQGKELAVDCAIKAAIGNSLDGNMSKLSQILYIENLYEVIPESKRDRKFPADTAYIHSRMRQVIDNILFICNKGENELKR